MTGSALALLEASGTVLPTASRRRSGIGFALEAFRLPDPDGTLDEAFEGTQDVPVVSSDEGYRHPIHIGSTGPANAVNVILGVAGHVEVEDMAHAWHIKPTRGNV